MNSFFDSLGRLGSSALNAASDALNQQTARNQLRAEQMQKIRYMNYKNWVYQTFESDYMDFAGKFKNCMTSNHMAYGVFCPKYIEDIFPQKRVDMIDYITFPDGRYNVTFRFEVKREAVNQNIHTISAGALEYVPVEKFERLLQADLPKYIGEFSFTGLSVSEIAGRKAKITICGVDRPQTWQQPDWGMMI